MRSSRCRRYDRAGRGLPQRGDFVERGVGRRTDAGSVFGCGSRTYTTPSACLFELERGSHIDFGRLDESQPTARFLPRPRSD